MVHIWGTINILATNGAPGVRHYRGQKCTIAIQGAVAHLKMRHYYQGEQWRTRQCAITVPGSAPPLVLRGTCATWLLMAHLLVMRHYYGCHDFFLLLLVLCKV